MSGFRRRLSGASAALFVFALGPAAAQDEAPAERIGAAEASMMTDPAHALSLTDGLESAPLSALDAAAVLRLKAEALMRLGRAAEAEGLPERGLALLGDAEVPALRGDLHLARGRLARAAGRTGEALGAYHTAYEYYVRADESRDQAIALQSIGSVYNDAHAHERVLDYYARAAATYQGDPMLTLSAQNNQANALKALGRSDEALAMFRAALSIADELGSDLLRLRILTNIADLQVGIGALADAEGTLENASALLGKVEGATWADFVSGVHAQLLAAQGRDAAALAEMESLFAGKALNATPAAYRAFHEEASRLYEAAGEEAMALAHLRAFMRLDTAAREAAASANLALRAAEFDFATQELEIERLTSRGLRDRLSLVQAVQARRRLLLYALVWGVGAVVVGSFLTIRLLRRKNTALQDMHDELAVSHDDLTDANEALVAANESKMRFLAATSHEIRTPLNGIIGMTEVVLRDMDEGDENRSRIRIAHEAGQSLLVIVNDLLDMAKIERNETDIVRSEVVVQGLLGGIAALWQKAADDKGIDLVLTLEDCPERAVLDEKHTRQIVNNLLNNAIKFTEAGSVAVTARVADDTLSVEVRDSGIGIAEADQERVFRMFEQAQGGASRRYGGTGLGLAICRRLARLMNGDVVLESVPGEGSVFTFTLPLGKAAMRPAAAPQPAPRAVPQDISDVRVLVAEDNTVNQMVVKAYLSSHVASIEVAPDGQAALEAVQGGGYDLVLMDKQMPRMDGVEATLAIRALTGPEGAVPIIAVTADAFQGAKDEMIAAGCDGFVPKPLSEAHIIAVIEQVLAARKAGVLPAGVKARAA
ncbi:ATP-binding protein [Parvularcula dongshanensis]|uniref:histidine kinase n=1 Tax=Parvularcula dongshanensis TaxID=1173995 RepID=A0A840I216_9PROT|nr:ATP-binding protein [Parvularcula dongshanensis]MBB4659056.1 signal transduction histidine kinase [Parvularcula dongshanensis]